MAFLTRGLKIDFRDERGERFETSFQYEGGIVDFVKYLHSQGTREPLHPKIVYVQETSDVGEVEVALQWNNSYQEALLSFANNINTHEGGTHLSGFRSALTSTINNYARQTGELKEKDQNLQGEDVREGLTAIISVKLREPQFEGQTKTKLGNPPIAGFVQAAVNKGLAEFLEENPSDGRTVIRKSVESAHARDAARKARDLTRRKSALENSTLPGQARRLLGPRPRARRDLHRRGRLRRRLREGGAQPEHPGDPAAARQDHQRREEPHRQGALEQGDPGADHGDRHRDPRGVRHREGPLPQGHPHDGRRRGRGAHPHARADLPLPRDARADRRRLRLHREAAALQGQVRQAGRLHREGVRARGGPPARQARAHGGARPRARRSSSSPTRAGSGTAGCSSSTRAGRPPCGPSSATTRSPSSRSPTSSTTGSPTSRASSAC